METARRFHFCSHACDEVAEVGTRHVVLPGDMAGSLLVQETREVVERLEAHLREVCPPDLPVEGALEWAFEGQLDAEAAAVAVEELDVLEPVCAIAPSGGAGNSKGVSDDVRDERRIDALGRCCGGRGGPAGLRRLLSLRGGRLRDGCDFFLDDLT